MMKTKTDDDCNVSDNRLRTMWQRYLSARRDKLLTNMRLCGSRVNPQTNIVGLYSNGENAKFVGVLSCHSAWACPHCTARIMAKKGIDIAAAIDALATWHKQRAIMITFTMPHTKDMSCWMSTTIMQTAWRKFTHAGNHASRKCNYGKGFKGHDPYGAFREELGITHNIRVWEYTWGFENSWHPHVHALYWVNQDLADEVLKYEESLHERWWLCLKDAHKKFLKQVSEYSAEQINEIVNAYYADWRKYPKTGHRAVWISKTDDGRKVKFTGSAHYLSGWGGDLECTKTHRKEAAPSHYTPWQILNEAYANSGDTEEKNKWLDLFYEYASTTIGRRRVEFSSRSGLTKIIEKWKQTKTYAEVFKKKAQDKVQGHKRICWFSKEQWYSICAETRKDLRSDMLEMALKMPADLAFVAICTLLYDYGIDIKNNTKHRDLELIDEFAKAS